MEKINLNRALQEVMTTHPESLDTLTLKINLDRAMKIEHSATATVLRYLAEYEVRGLHLKDGFPSIFKFLTDGHGYSEAAAMRRLTAARFGRDCPEVFVMIERGDLSLSLASMAARVFESKEIHVSKKLEVLKALSRKSKTAAEKILVRFGAKPKAPVKKESVRVISGTTTPAPTSDVKSMDSTSAKNIHSSDSSSPLSVFEGPTEPKAGRPAVAQEENRGGKKANHESTGSMDAEAPAAEEKPVCEYQLTVRLEADAMEAFLRAKDLMGAKDFASTIEKLAMFYNERKDPMVDRPKKTTVKKTESQMASSPENPQTRDVEGLPNPIPPLAEVSEGDLLLAAISVDVPTEPLNVFQAEDSKGQDKKISRYIPALVKREVFRASGGQCCYVDSESGRRCAERKYLEIDHIKPFAMGGDHSAANLQLLCKSHNLMRARQDFGVLFIRNKIQSRQVSTGA